MPPAEGLWFRVLRRQPYVSLYVQLQVPKLPIAVYSKASQAWAFRVVRPLKLPPRVQSHKQDAHTRRQCQHSCLHDTALQGKNNRLEVARQFGISQTTLGTLGKPKLPSNLQAVGVVGTSSSEPW